MKYLIIIYLALVAGWILGRMTVKAHIFSIETGTNVIHFKSDEYPCHYRDTALVKVTDSRTHAEYNINCY